MEYSGNKNCLVVGAAASGKTQLIKGSLLNMDSSFVVTDPSGVVVSSVGKILSENGYRIKIFNLCDMERSNRYNPLAYIHGITEIDTVVNYLVQSSGQGMFLADCERMLYRACISYLLYHSESEKNLGEVARLIDMGESTLDDLFDVLPKNTIAWMYYSAFKTKANTNVENIFNSCITRLQPFLTPQVNNLTKFDELELEKIGDEKTALFIVTAPWTRSCDFLVPMLYSQVFETLYRLGEERTKIGESAKSKLHVRCMMDEFGNYGNIYNFIGWLATMCKYNISTMATLMSITQLKALHKDEWEDMVGFFEEILFIGGCTDVETEDFFSLLFKKRCGLEKYNLSRFEKLDFSREIISLQRNYPMVYEKFKMENHPLYEQTGDANPENRFRYDQMDAYDIKEGTEL